MFHLENSPCMPVCMYWPGFIRSALCIWLFKVTKLDFEIVECHALAISRLRYRCHCDKMNNIFVSCVCVWEHENFQQANCLGFNTRFGLCFYSFTVPCIDSFLVVFSFFFCRDDFYSSGFLLCSLDPIGSLQAKHNQAPTSIHSGLIYRLTS